MDFRSNQGYPVSYPTQSHGLQGVHSYTYGAPHMFGSRYGDPQSRETWRGYGSYSGGSNPQSRDVTAASTYSSYDIPPSSKRPRLDAAQQSNAPASASSVWTPENSGHARLSRNQPEDLAHLTNPTSANSASTHPEHVSFACPSEISQDNTGQTSQQESPEEIPAQLEQQIRGLSDYNDVSNEHNSTPKRRRRSKKVRLPLPSPPGEQQSASELNLPERGARPGKMLNLNCQHCHFKKQKCTKGFPCTECLNAGVICVPSKRKTPWAESLDSLPEPPNDDSPQQASRQYGDAVAGLTYKGWSHESPNRKYLLNMPPVVGHHQEWSNMRLKYNPFPADLDAVREKLFKMEKPMLLNSQQFVEYWPHISNFYNRTSAPVIEDSNSTQIEIWECRNKARLSRSKREYPSSGTGRRKRDTKTHLLESSELCKVRFRIVAYIKHADTDEPHKAGLGHCLCVPAWMYIERRPHAQAQEHNHTMESLDQFKRSDALLFFAQRKVEEGGYMYSSVTKWLKEKFSDKTKQVQFMTSHDVANAARRWRVLNRDLELVETITEPSPEEERRKSCLDLIDTTSVDGLRKALVDVCTRLPEAAGVVMPYLEAAQEVGSSDGDGHSKIQEGDEIVVPEPGLPQPKPTGRPASLQLEVSDGILIQDHNLAGLPNARDGIINVEEDYSKYLQAPGVRLAPRPPYLMQPQPAVQSTSASSSAPNGVSPTPAAQHASSSPVPHPSSQPYSHPYSYPAFHQRAAPMSPPSTFAQLPKKQYAHPPVVSAEGPPVVGGHHHSMPRGNLGWDVPKQTPRQSNSTAEQDNPAPGHNNRTPELQRPTWAREDAPSNSDKAKEKASVGGLPSVENDRTAMQRQLDAELEA